MFKDHADMVAKLAKPGEEILPTLTPEKVHLLHMAMGAVGELGELADAIKKHVFYDKPLDMEHTVEEAGDLEFYLEGLRQGLKGYGLTLGRKEIIDANMTKLSMRYHTGSFSNDQASERADKIPTVGKQHIKRWNFNVANRVLEITATTPDGVTRDFFYQVNELSNNNEEAAFKYINELVVKEGYHER